MAFKPEFEISPNLSNLLTQIALCRERILTLKILPKREVGLIRSARLRMIHSSTAIEGNPLNLKEVEQVLQGKIVTGISEKDRLEVINYEKVMRHIDRLVEKQKTPSWEKTILKIHQLTTDKVLPPDQSGHYRKGPVYIVSRPSNKILYTAPEAIKVPRLMRSFCSWLEDEKIKELSPVLISATAHHQFVTIHPFSDGNGRTARALATLILYQKGYDIKKMFALEDFYNLNRPDYYKAISDARKEKNLTIFLEYFAQGLLAELQQILQKVEHFTYETKGEKQPIYLSQRQRDILDFVAINGKIFRNDVVDIANVSPKTAYRELEFLREKGLLKRKAKGPATHYVLEK